MKSSCSRKTAVNPLRCHLLPPSATPLSEFPVPLLTSSPSSDLKLLPCFLSVFKTDALLQGAELSAEDPWAAFWREQIHLFEDIALAWRGSAVRGKPTKESRPLRCWVRRGPRGFGSLTPKKRSEIDGNNARVHVVRYLRVRVVFEQGFLRVKLKAVEGVPDGKQKGRIRKTVEGPSTLLASSRPSLHWTFPPRTSLAPTLRAPNRSTFIAPAEPHSRHVVICAVVVVHPAPPGTMASAGTTEASACLHLPGCQCSLKYLVQTQPSYSTCGPYLPALIDHNRRLVLPKCEPLHRLHQYLSNSGKADAASSFPKNAGPQNRSTNGKKSRRHRQAVRKEAECFRLLWTPSSGHEQRGQLQEQRSSGASAGARSASLDLC